MRLLSTQGEDLTFKFFVSEEKRPKYAIPSHTWLDDEDEVVLADLANLDRAKAKPGWDKILNARRLAKKNGYDWIWIDTVCINKESSAEFSEAINSMFAWYRNSAICIVHLFDLTCDHPMHFSPGNLELGDPPVLQGAIGDCRWFTRGWTLQELLAPRPDTVYFYNAMWTLLAGLTEIAPAVAHMTGIDTDLLQVRIDSPRRFIPSYTVAQRLSWAAYRVTTRKEDQAYSLLGLFDVSLPIIYGEGDKAFHKLRKAIMAAYPNDLSLLLGERLQREQYYRSLYPSSAHDFRNCRDIVSWAGAPVVRYAGTLDQRSLELPVVRSYMKSTDLLSVDHRGTVYHVQGSSASVDECMVAILPYRRQQDCTSLFAMFLKEAPRSPGKHLLIGIADIEIDVALTAGHPVVPTTIVIRQAMKSNTDWVEHSADSEEWPSKVIVRVQPPEDRARIVVLEARSSNGTWNADSQQFLPHPDLRGFQTELKLDITGIRPIWLVISIHTVQRRRWDSERRTETSYASTLHLLSDERRREGSVPDSIRSRNGDRWYSPAKELLLWTTIRDKLGLGEFTSDDLSLRRRLEISPAGPVVEAILNDTIMLGERVYYIEINLIRESLAALDARYPLPVAPSWLDEPE